MAQCFAIMPVHGVRATSPQALRFQWISLRVLYTVFCLVWSVIFAVLSCIHMSEEGLTFSRTSPTVFFACSALASLLFLQLAHHWPSLAYQWEKQELRFASRYGYANGLTLKFRLITGLVLSVAFVEHILSNAQIAVQTYNCGPPGLTFLRSFFTSKYYYFLDYLGYNFTITFCTAAISIIATFTWNYMDLFIILISVAIAERFKQLNVMVRLSAEKVVCNKVWQQIRLDYNDLSHLTKTVDSQINKIVLLSFATNLYFVCLQFLHSMKGFSSLLETLYYYWSFIYLFAKTCAVSISASDIHVKSKSTSTLLYSVPTECYSVEVERFINQVTSDHVALTGLNLFPVTRTLLLTVAGTIVTYEIVLMQLNVSADDSIQAIGNKEIGNLTVLCSKLY